MEEIREIERTSPYVYVREIRRVGGKDKMFSEIEKYIKHNIIFF